MQKMIGLFCFILVSISQIRQGSAADDDFDPTTLVLSDDIIAALFPKTCPADEFWKDERSSKVNVHCIFQKGHFGDELATFASDAETLGCKVDRGIAKYMADNFASPSYVNNPIYERIGEDCGVCGVKAACCGPKHAEKVAKEMIKKHPEIEGADPFYFQTIKGYPCTEQSKQACSLKPLAPADFDKLIQMQPFTKNVDRSDDCNFAQFGYTEWEAARENPSFPVAAPLYNKFLCRSLQTSRPRVNCVKNQQTKQCMCCCNSYIPQQSGSQWNCVQKLDKETEKICSTLA